MACHHAESKGLPALVSLVHYKMMELVRNELYIKATILYNYRMRIHPFIISSYCYYLWQNSMSKVKTIFPFTMETQMQITGPNLYAIYKT